MKSFRPAAWLALLSAMSLLSASAAPVGTTKQLIDHLGMEKIPVEGCWFKLTYTSADRIPGVALPERYAGASRVAGGAIYALVTREDFSALHKLKTDEVWHFHAGSPMELLLLRPDGKSEVVILGADILAGQHAQYTVPAGVWMGARPQQAGPEAYGFFGTTMAPGFDYADFEIGYRDELQQAYPAQRELIAALTREEHAKRSAPVVAAAATPTAPAVFAPESIATITVAPGVELRELIGRVSQAKTGDYSVARFALAPGKGTGTSYNKVGEEVFLVISGRGTVVVGTEASPVTAGSVVVLKPLVKHSLTAAADSALELYAITVPAFSPDDYVLVKE